MSQGTSPSYNLHKRATTWIEAKSKPFFCHHFPKTMYSLKIFCCIWMSNQYCSHRILTLFSILYCKRQVISALASLCRHCDSGHLWKKHRLIDAGKTCSCTMTDSARKISTKILSWASCLQFLHVHSLCYHQNADEDKNIRTNETFQFSKAN